MSEWGKRTWRPYPEVENLGLAGDGGKEVCGLDVAVDNTLRVSCRQRISNLDAHLQHQLNR